MGGCERHSYFYEGPNSRQNERQTLPAPLKSSHFSAFFYGVRRRKNEQKNEKKVGKVLPFLRLRWPFFAARNDQPFENLPTKMHKKVEQKDDQKDEQKTIKKAAKNMKKKRNQGHISSNSIDGTIDTITQVADFCIKKTQ